MPVRRSRRIAQMAISPNAPKTNTITIGGMHPRFARVVLPHVLMKQHGFDAEFVAAQRPDVLLAEGDHLGCSIFLKMLRTIGALRREKPREAFPSQKSGMGPLELADGEGFEPPRGVNLCRFSRPVP